MRAICWLLNKRIIFYLDFCSCVCVCVNGCLDTSGGSHCRAYASYPAPWLCERVIWAVAFSFLFFFLPPFSSYELSSAMRVRTARVIAVVEHAGLLHKPFACCMSVYNLRMLLSLQAKKRKHIKGTVHVRVDTNPNSLWGSGAMRKDEGAWNLSREHQHWMFHLNLGSILCGILITLPLVWIDSPFKGYG